jgi:hypothetical protein
MLLPQFPDEYNTKALSDRLRQSGWGGSWDHLTNFGPEQPSDSGFSLTHT